MLIAIFFLCSVPATLLHTAIHVLAFRLAAAHIEEIGLFFGPRVWQRMVGQTRLRINLLPSGGYVKADEESFARLGSMRRIPVFLSAPLGLLIVGFLLSGDPGASLRIAERLISGTLHPVRDGSAVLDAFRDRFRSAPVGTFGRFLIGMSFFNLTPLPICNGGQALFELLEVCFGPMEVTKNVLSWLGVLVVLAGMGAWIVAWWYA